MKFLDLPKNQSAFPIKNFLLIPAKVAIFFPTMFRNLILFTIVILEKSF